MLVLAFLLSFVTSYVAMYIVSFFSGEGGDLITVLKATSIVWGVSAVLNFIQMTGIIGVAIGTIVSMITLVKLFDFEMITAFFAGALYAWISYILLIVIIASLVT